MWGTLRGRIDLYYEVSVRLSENVIIIVDEQNTMALANLKKLSTHSYDGAIIIKVKGCF